LDEGQRDITSAFLNAIRATRRVVLRELLEGRSFVEILQNEKDDR
jgi:hypothetical protein